MGAVAPKTNKHLAGTFTYIFNSQKVQQDATVYQILLVHIYMKLNMFRATHRPSSRA